MGARWSYHNGADHIKDAAFFTHFNPVNEYVVEVGEGLQKSRLSRQKSFTESDQMAKV